MKHGFMSEKAVLVGGSVYWRTSEGMEVEVTGVYETRERGEERYQWPDRHYVGPVTEWSRGGRAAQYPPACIDILAHLMNQW